MLAITSAKTKRRPRRGVAPGQGLRAKFALTYILLIAAVLIILNTYPVIASQDLVFRSKRDSLQSQASLLSSGLAGLDAVTTDGVSQVMEQLALQNLTQVMVTDSQGLVVYDTDQSAGSLGKPCPWGELHDALGGQDIFHSSFSSGVFQSRAAAPVASGGSVLGGVCLFEYDATQGGLILGIQSNLRSISILICGVAVVTSLVLSKAITRRIAALLGAIRRVREGEYSHRVKVSGHDELSLLADEFNQLTLRLQTTEEVRRRFVSDASHELKTPLTSIRLLSDSILQADAMDPDTLREFIADIGQEADRLTRITEKLLTLTRMDARADAPAREETPPIQAAPVVERVAHMLAPLAREQGVALSCQLEPGRLVPCGEDDLYQIAFNLMENAIKYNLPGGEVRVTLAGTGAGVILRVDDTGIGVPEEELSKIFDRFYRVDKARSRAAGGTGLGLSIVLDAVRLHGGTVEARRREDRQGTSFVVTFPTPEPEKKD